MPDAVTSSRRPQHTSRPSSYRPTTTPAARPPTNNPGSVGQNMPPLLSPRVKSTSTPQNQAPPNLKAPSPNYFGFQSEDSSFLSDSPQHTKGNWSPPSSTVRSTAAASPSVVPLDQNPEYDAFRRQSEGKAFNLGGLGNNFTMSNAPAARQNHGKPSSKTEPAEEVKPHTHSKSLDPSTAEVGRSPKRVLSPGSMILPEEARRASPASFAKCEPDQSKDAQPRFALPLDNQGMNGLPKARAENLPNPSDSETQMVTPQHVVNLLDSRTEQVLLLDLRVQTQYAKSHITGALNLCIPTTLLKRPSFNVQKLADAFKDDAQRRKFEKWRNSTYIIVYDGSSALLKDAQMCVNTIKKFRGEGYEGSLYIVKGGFADFAKRFPGYVDTSMTPSDAGSKAGVDFQGPEIAPVVGGCPMPATDKPANPFFGNIRQNMDLIGGVGQIPIKHPSKASQSAEREFPEWLQKASDDGDQGKKVAGKFEQIERREKKRMEDALSGKVSWGGTPKKQQAPSDNDKCVQIAGIEKGTKNRYNNIWPFEHSRVKLQGVSSSGCDYVNASHIKAARSHKRYISTQAPIPATFNDFWNIIWQQDVRVIVMLTAEKEGAQVKAHNYWEQKQYGPLHLDFLSEKRASIEPARIHRHRQQNQQRPTANKRVSLGPQISYNSTSSSTSGGGSGFFDNANSTGKEEKPSGSSSEEPYVTVRRFTLSHERHPFEPMREITQLQYSNWPDFGAPAHPAHLLGLVEQCDNVVRSSSSKGSGGAEPQSPSPRPVLVHCSAGCGRTGTFCTVDSVIDMLKRQRISRKSSSVRQGTPMDIDSPPQKSASNGSNDGFFNPESGSKEVVDEGPWLGKDDQDLVERTVEDFRHQRISMVQSLRQYVLCYESVMEWCVQRHLDDKGKRRT